MKIKASLLPKGKNLDENDDIIQLEIVDPAEAVKLRGAMALAYIELDTGGVLDELPEKNKEALEGFIEIRLAQFANYLLAAIEFDIAISQKGESGTPGYESIEEGMIVISKGLRKIMLVDIPRA